MCGIAGLVELDRSASREAIEAMVASLVHRGPDDAGVWAHEGVALGMRRLAVLDLSAQGHQPMSNEDGSVLLVFNGEIYNYRDLRSRLLAEGHRFVSATDTEVLIHGYEQFGLRGLLERVNGMFAFALLDRKSRRLYLARDRVGVKPLYLRRGARQLSFASEIRAFAKDGRGAPSAEAGFVGSYLRTGYIPSPRTAFAGVERLQPGTFTEIDLGDGTLREERYYDLRPVPTSELPDSAAELEARFASTLDLAIRRQLVADAPLGVFLSGGLDSTAITLSAAGRVPGKLQTFSVGFEDSDRGDELAAARQVADRLRVQQNVFRIGTSTLEELDLITESLEEPLGDSAVVPLWNLCRSTRQRVTVALSGEGGDEALGGYGRYAWTAVAEQLASSPATVRRPVTWLAAHVPERTKGPLNFVRRAGKLSSSLSLPESDRYLRWFDLFTEEERAALHPSSAEPIEESVSRLFAEARELGLDPVQRMQFVDARTFLLDNLLLKSDKLSMAHSLEVRVPLVDPALLELGIGLPRWAKVSRGSTKRLLRTMVGRRLPSIARRPKRGFELPIDAWLRSVGAGRLKDRLCHGALTSRLGFGAAAVERILSAHLTGRDQGRKLFALLMLERWAARYC